MSQTMTGQFPVQCLKATESSLYQSSQTLIALDGVQCAILSTFCYKPLLYEGLLLITLDPAAYLDRRRKYKFKPSPSVYLTSTLVESV